MTEKSKEKILEYIKNNHLDYDGVFGELVDASKRSVDLRWQLILDFYSPLQTHTSKVMSKEEMLIHELFKQCKSFKKQRDELINDIADIKRKAEVFDEIKEYTLDKIETLTTRQEFAPNFNNFGYFGNLLIAYKNIENKINDLERGSDVED